jgi:outer membrane protein TolC
MGSGKPAWAGDHVLCRATTQQGHGLRRAVACAWACASALTLALHATPSPAQVSTLPGPIGLQQVHAWALAQDGQVRSARQDLAAAQARLDGAHGGRWPQVNLTGNVNRTAQDLAYQQSAVPDRSDVFRTYGYNLQLTQALYHREEQARREGAALAVEQAAAQAHAAELGLWVRVAQPWFEACQYRWQAEAARAESRRQGARRDAAQRRWMQGDLPRHELDLAEADMALARARLAEAESERAQRLDVLAILAGQPVSPGDEACPLSDGPAAPPPLTAWLDQVTAHSPELEAARRAVTVAEAQVKQAEGGHGPMLDLVASDGLSKQGPTASVGVGSRTRTQSIGLQLSLPIFTGGTLSAKVREAAAGLAKAQAELDALTSRVRTEVSSNWRSLQVSRGHAEAAQWRVLALQAQQQAVALRQRQGLSTLADVLAADQDLAQARADAVRVLAMALLAQAKLQAQAGGQSPAP